MGNKQNANIRITFWQFRPDEDHEDHRVHLVVDVRPPFLERKDSSIIVQKTEMTLAVKDLITDVAVFAREGPWRERTTKIDEGITLC